MFNRFKTMVCILFISVFGICFSSAIVAESALEVRVGYFPNMTHSQALIGLTNGDFETALGNVVKIKATAFNAGPSVIEALFAGQIDISYIGPNPAINGFIKSEKDALRVVAGATSGGASLVLSKANAKLFPDQLTGLKFGSPQLGNTQDVALRSYLLEKNLKAKEKGGTVEIFPMENPLILDAFRRNELAGAWVPEPWATRLVLEAEGVRVLDERKLWADGKFPTAVVIVSRKFLAEHPDIVRKWLATHISITRWSIAHPEEACAIVNQAIKAITSKPMNTDVLKNAWSMMSPDWDPNEKAIIKSAEDAYKLGYLKQKPDLAGLVDDKILKDILAKEKNK